MLESALVFTVFMVMVFGIMDWGRMMLANNFVSYAAREATRYASVHGTASGHSCTSTDLTNLVNGAAVGLDTSKITVTPTWSPNHNAGSTVSVTVQYAFTPIAPYVPTATLKAASQMVILQ